MARYTLVWHKAPEDALVAAKLVHSWIETESDYRVMEPVVQEISAVGRQLAAQGKTQVRVLITHGPKNTSVEPIGPSRRAQEQHDAFIACFRDHRAVARYVRALARFFCKEKIDMLVDAPALALWLDAAMARKRRQLKIS